MVLVDHMDNGPETFSDPRGGKHGSGRSGPRRRRAALTCVAVYVFLGFLSNLPAWLQGVSHVVQCGACADIGQEVWFLGWEQFAVAHGHTGLLTSALNVPVGVNLMENTSMPLAGLVGAPITALFGPIATYNVLFSAAFAGSATAAFFVLRRWVRWTPAAFIGGLVFGFSPYMIGEGHGHLFLLLVMLLPVMLLCLDEILIRQRVRSAVVGAVLGIAAAAQLGLSSEILAWSGVFAAIGVIVLVVANRSSVREHAPYALRALGVTIGVFVVISAYPLWIMFAGPLHTSRPGHPPSTVAMLSTDVASPVIPTSNQLLTAGLSARGNSYVLDTPTAAPGEPLRLPDPAEDGSYIGIPLLLLLLAGAWRYRRDRILRFSITMASAALLLSAGSSLHFLGRNLHVPLPFDLLVHLPVLDQLIASRASLVMWLFVAMSLAVLLDRARFAHPRHRRPHTLRPLGLLGVVAAALVPLLPAWPYQMAAVQIPPYFSNHGPVSTLRNGSVLLTYPVARWDHAFPMVWQAVDHFRFRIPAGEAFVPKPNVTTLGAMFDSCYTGSPPASASLTLRKTVQADLKAWGITTIVVPDNQPHANCAVEELRGVLGVAPRHIAHATVWRSVPSILQRSSYSLPAQG